MGFSYWANSAMRINSAALSVVRGYHTFNDAMNSLGYNLKCLEGSNGEMERDDYEHPTLDYDNYSAETHKDAVYKAIKLFGAELVGERIKSFEGYDGDFDYFWEDLREVIHDGMEKLFAELSEAFKALYGFDIEVVDSYSEFNYSGEPFIAVTDFLPESLCNIATYTAWVDAG